MRYFGECSYLGTNYSGWQRQPKAISVQQIIEEVLSKRFQEDISIVGCGRTDAGVHAKQSYFHFDSEVSTVIDSLYDLNNMLPADIGLFNLFEVDKDAHARFDAISRSYHYHITSIKSPFLINQAWHNKRASTYDLDVLNESSELIRSFKSFYPFCKSNTDVKTMDCNVSEAKWVRNDTDLVFHISANRFLRGMVRLVVGACVNIAEGKLSLSDLREGLEKQERIEPSYSVPAHGLYLDKIVYPADTF